MSDIVERLNEIPRNDARLWIAADAIKAAAAEITSLRAENEKLREALKTAHDFGYAAASGPANDHEIEEMLARMTDSWNEYRDTYARAALKETGQ